MPSPDQLTHAVAWFAALAHALSKRDRRAERKARRELHRLGVIVRFRKTQSAAETST